MHEELQDSVDRLVAGWAAQGSDLDPVLPGVLARLQRVRSYVEQEMEHVFAAHGLTLGAFEVLATLAREGPSHQLPQRALNEALRLTSGTVSVRIDRLAAEGLVRREPDPSDGRGVLVTLTDEGLARWQAAAPAHRENLARLLAPLTTDERETLAALLRRLLVAYEAESRHGPLGMELAPAHIAMAVRRAAGLEAVPGLLVRDVAAGSAAARAGLRTGDLLTHADGRPTRAQDAFAAIVAAAKRPTRVRVLRGADEIELTVDAD
jgi:DNA-binding MarR family transcriptional regulator